MEKKLKNKLNWKEETKPKIMIENIKVINAYMHGYVVYLD